MFLESVEEEKVLFVLLVVVILVGSNYHDPACVSINPAGMFLMVLSDVLFLAVPPILIRKETFDF